MTQNKSFRNGVDFAFRRISHVVDQLGNQLQDARERALSIPDRVYSGSTRRRIDALPHPGKWIFEEVLDAMQDADEMGGTEGQAYIDLMNAIIEEAIERAQTAQAQAKEEQP
jgi:hypothetical protein